MMDAKSVALRCHEMLVAGKSTSEIRSFLTEAGFDADSANQIVAQCAALHDGGRTRQLFQKRCMGWAMFVAFGGFFAYGVFFAAPGHHVFVYPLLGLAVWGLLMALLP